MQDLFAGLSFPGWEPLGRSVAEESHVVGKRVDFSGGGTDDNDWSWGVPGQGDGQQRARSAPDSVDRTGLARLERRQHVREARMPLEAIG